MPSKRDVEIADTLPPEEDATADGDDTAASPPPPPGDGPPVARWDRYELQELLGKGGMGSVYKARDRRLGRTVAIKFIQGANPNLTMRFLQEARAQARIDHPNVCRVYEADEVDGRAYIALQYIAGAPLHRAAARMSLDEKIAAVRDVAVAVHEAHKLGIVHRDLKPGNVLVERRDDGRWVPIVMDFGLAREATVEAGITESGVPLGTPAYMSPEQARGDIHAIDRRSDVYGLGATLYELLTRQVPFPTSSVAEAFQRAIHDDPPPPRSHVPGLPVDLETITLKCLAKDPAQRYPSARALAEDLGRYLDGEPILGRREPWWQRLRRRARRNRALVAVGAASLVAIVAVATLGIRERVRAADRARLAEQLGREAAAIEGELREAYLHPLHDTRDDRAHVLERMRSIAATRHGLGELGDAIVHEALGRGHLALHEWREANDDLAATDAAPQTPELHAARGRALGELYRRAVEEARYSVDRAIDKTLLARQQQQLAQQYLAPALAQLEDVRALGGSSVLLEARIALYRRDFAAAGRLAHTVQQTLELPEARRLEAEAAYGTAVDAFDHGDYTAAQPALTHARALYAAAIEAARSDPSLYEAAAQTSLRLAEIGVREGRAPSEWVERAVEAIDAGALRADPEDAHAYTIKADVLLLSYRALALSDVEHQRPPAKLLLLERIAEAAARAVELDPRDPNAWTSLGNAHVYRAIFEIYRQGQSDPWLKLAFDEFGTALAIEPGRLWAHNGLGSAHRWRATNLSRDGGDPRPEYRAALTSYEHAAQIDPEYLAACANQINVLVAIAEYDEAIADDPQAVLGQALEVGERCVEIDRSFYAVHNNLAQAHLARAQYLVDNRGNPDDSLAEAQREVEASAAIRPNTLEVAYFRAVGSRIHAMFDLQRHTDPAPAIDAGRKAVQDALSRSSSSALTYIEAARLDLLKAESEGQLAARAATLASAREAADRAIQIDGKRADAHLVAAEVCLAMARAAPASADIERGRDEVRQALVINPRLRKAQVVRDELAPLQRTLETRPK